MKYSLRKLTALLIAVLMLLSVFSGALADTEYSNQLEIGVSLFGYKPGGGTSPTSVDHIDVGCKNIPVYINGEKVDDMSFTKNDVKNEIVKVSIVAEGATATWSKDNVSTSTDSKGNPQVRFNGTFPVVTKNAPVTYTITVTKNVVYQRTSIPVVFTARLNYWSSANVCNGLQGKENQEKWQKGEVVKGSGIDIAFGGGEGQVGSISFEKTVSGLELTEDTEYTFKVTNTSTNAVFYETCEVSATTNDGRKTVGMIPFGTYQIEEVDAEVDGYDLVTTYQPTTQQVTVSASNPNANISVTNRYTPSITSVSVKKVWNDGNNQDNKRPTSVTVKLLADGNEVTDKTLILSATNNWAGTFENLPLQNEGVDIVYTVEEVSVTGYSSSVAEKDGVFVITNTHELEKVTVSGSKTWEDANNQDNKRPASITINLYAGSNKIDSKTVTAADNWSWSFTNLPKYENGELIDYSITEDPVADYSTTYDENSYNVTNSHTPEKVTVSGSKTWEDANNQDNKRPESITINLLKNGEKIASKTVTAADNWSWSFEGLDKYANGTKITYSITEESVAGYSTTYDENSYDVTNHYTPGKVSVTVVKSWNDNNNQDNIRPASVVVQLLADGEKTNKTEELNAGNNWQASFTGLDEYKAGKKIVYTVDELTVIPGYSTEVTGNAKDGFIITNSHTPEKIEKIAGSKTWVDNDNEDGIRPKSITINLLANGEPVASQVVTAQDGWTWTFENLDKYSQGKEIVYTISENPVAGYTTRVDGYNVTNTHTPEKTVVSGSKTWDDADNQDNKRPESITINLLADGKKVASKVVTAKDGWKWSFTNLPKYENGRRIVYTITEEAVEGYTAKVDGYDVTNSYDPEMIDEIAGSKTWNDSDNQDGKRPESITIRLYADGVEVASKVVTAEDGWAWSFTNLPKFNDGVEIVYTIAEDAVEDYITSVEGFNVTNSHDPEMIDEIAGGKTWDDSDNQDGIRPESITINLLANGQTVATQVVTAENGWTWSFTKLPKYENGVEIVYTIAEEAVEGYIASTDGFNLTNIHVAETIDEIAGSKTWKDDNNSGKTRPESITIRLLADGNEVAARVVTADDQWSWSFTKLPKYAAGKEIVYTIVEDAVKGYTAKVDGYNVTNTLDNEEVPKTGDPRSDLQRTMLYLGMTFLMLGTACVVASMRKRKTNR